MDVVCSILTMEMQVKDARIKELESLLENNVIAVITPHDVWSEFNDVRVDEDFDRECLVLQETCGETNWDIIQAAITYVLHDPNDDRFWAGWDEPAKWVRYGPRHQHSSSRSSVMDAIRDRLIATQD